MYFAGTVPSDPKDLPAFLRAEFLRIARAFSGQSATGWRDVPIEIWWDQAAGTGPSMASALTGNVRQLFWTGGGGTTAAYGQVQLPHDYKPGTDIYIYAHWSPTTTSGGNVKWEFEVTYAKGHSQAAFPAAVTATVTAAASTTALMHQISEVQLSAASPSGSQIDTDNLEADGVIAMRIRRNSADAADTAGNILSHGFFLHYQSDRTVTSAKAPPF